MHPIFLLHLLAATSSKSHHATAGSGSSFFIFIIIALVIAYFLFFRPQKRRQQAQRQAQSAIEEGDTVATIGGILGRVVSLTKERAVLEVADGTRMEFLRQAIRNRVDPVPVADEEEPEARRTRPRRTRTGAGTATTQRPPRGRTTRPRVPTRRGKGRPSPSPAPRWLPPASLPTWAGSSAWAPRPGERGTRPGRRARPLRWRRPSAVASDARSSGG